MGIHTAGVPGYGRGPLGYTAHDEATAGNRARKTGSLKEVTTRGTGSESPIHALATQAAVASLRSGRGGEGISWGPEGVAARRELGVLWPSVRDPGQFVARSETSKDTE